MNFKEKQILINGLKDVFVIASNQAKKSRPNDDLFHAVIESATELIRGYEMLLKHYPKDNGNIISKDALKRYAKDWCIKNNIFIVNDTDKNYHMSNTYTNLDKLFDSLSNDSFENIHLGVNFNDEKDRSIIDKLEAWLHKHCLQITYYGSIPTRDRQKTIETLNKFINLNDK